MPAAPGNTYNLSGRPRQLDRELARMVEAAAHARQIVEQTALVAVMTDAPDHRAAADRDLAAGIRELREIEHRVGELAWLAQEIEAARPARRKGKRKRAIGADPIDQWIMGAAVDLDRMADHLGVAQ